MPSTSPDTSQAALRQQTRTGLGLAAAVGAAWLIGHVWAVWRLDAAETPLLAAMLFLLQAWLSVGLFIIAHDAMHGTLAPLRPRLQRAAGELALRLYMGFSFARLLPKHHDHHRHAGHAGDPDFDEHNPSAPLRWYVTFMRRYMDLGVIATTGIVVTGYAALLYLVGGAERAAHILFWAGPSLLASVQLFYFGTYRPHCHRDGEAFADRHNSRSNDYGEAVSLLTCFHFGYHHEHHAQPWLPWWKLPGARRAALRDRAETEDARAGAPHEAEAPA